MTDDVPQIARAHPGASGPDGFDEIFRVHERDVRRLCRRMLGDEASAEDAAAEAFVRAQQALASFDESRPVRPWLMGIAANHCVDVLRRRGTERRLFDASDLETADLPDRGPSPLQQTLLAEERETLRRAIDALPPKYRLPLVLRHFAELDYEAIAEVLDVTRAQVGTLLFRGRRRLREILAGESQ